MLIENLSINVTPGGIPVTIHISQYDIGLRTFVFSPYTSHGTFTPDSAAAATLEGTKPDGNVIIHNCQYDSTTGQITYTVQEQLAAVAGKVWSKLTLRDTSGNAIGYTAIIWIVDMAGVQDGAIASDSDIAALQAFVNEFGTINAYRAALNGALAAVGGPYVASTVSQMTDHTKVYVYTGSQTGYTAGHWYYWDGSAWTDGGVYQAAAVETDKTLTVADMAADAKATGELKNDIINIADYLVTECVNISGWIQGSINSNNGANTQSTIRVRNNAYLNFGNSTIIVVDPGNLLKYQIFEYSADTTPVTDTYIGSLTNKLYVTGKLVFVVNPSHYYRIVASYITEADITPTDAALSDLTVQKLPSPATTVRAWGYLYCTPMPTITYTSTGATVSIPSCRVMWEGGSISAAAATLSVASNSLWLYYSRDNSAFELSATPTGNIIMLGIIHPTRYEVSYIAGATLAIGKTIAFMGDSLVAGSGTNNAFHMYIGDRYNYTCLNYGYGAAGYVRNNTAAGGGLVGQGQPGIGVKITSETMIVPNNVVARLPELANLDALDGIVIFAGTNDWSVSTSVEDFVSGVDSAISYCQTHYPEAPLIIMTPVQRKTGDNANSIGKTLRDYADMIIAECVKYGVPYVDTMTFSGLHPQNNSNDTTYYVRDDTGVSDGVHCNHLGHERIMRAVIDVINQQIKYNTRSMR